MAVMVETGLSAAFDRQAGSVQRWYDGRAFKLEGDRFAVILLKVTAQCEVEMRWAVLPAIGNSLREATTQTGEAYARLP